jgi:hypothetical protein
MTCTCINLSSAPYLTDYDCTSFINIVLTVLFLWPLYQTSSVISPTVRRVATRTLLAATVALLTSAANIFVLTILNGHEYGWVCLGSCSADVVVNAVALFWVTRPSASISPNLGDQVSAPSYVLRNVELAGDRRTPVVAGNDPELTSAPEMSFVPDIPRSKVTFESRSSSPASRPQFEEPRVTLPPSSRGRGRWRRFADLFAPPNFEREREIQSVQASK